MSEELPGPLAGAACTEVTLIRPLKWGKWHGAAVTDEGDHGGADCHVALLLAMT